MTADPDDRAPGLDLLYGFSGPMTGLEIDEMVHITVKSPKRTRILLLEARVFQDLVKELNTDAEELMAKKATVTYRRWTVSIGSSKYYSVIGVILS